MLKEWTHCLVSWVKDAVVPLVTDRIAFERQRMTRLDAEREARVEDNRKILVHFYSRHNPEKLADVEMLLNKYEGRMEMLFEAMRKKYGEVERGGEYATPENAGAPAAMARAVSLTSLVAAAEEEEEEGEEGDEESRDAASSWPSTLEEFARRLPEVRWIWTVRSSAIRRANAPLLPWPIQRMQLVSSPVEATLHNFELREYGGDAGHIAAPLVNRLRREHAERCAAAAGTESGAGREGTSGAGAAAGAALAQQRAAISTSEIAELRRSSFIKDRLEAAKAATATQEVSEEEQVRLVLTLFYVRRAAPSAFPRAAPPTAVRSPSHARCCTPTPLAGEAQSGQAVRSLRHHVRVPVSGISSRGAQRRGEEDGEQRQGVRRGALPPPRAQLRQRGRRHRARGGGWRSR